VKDPTDPEAGLAAFTVPGQAEAVWGMIEEGCKETGTTHVTAKHGPRLEQMERCDYIRPTILHCDSPDLKMANTEYMFPFTSVVKCPQEKMIEKIGGTLVASAITNDETWAAQLTDATNIDRLNIGAMPTIALNWLQPHEGSIVDFLFRTRAYQTPDERLQRLCNGG
jgi:acyl-CoA reductase-like NAD-dependent aldehyde dehydrogenase